MRDVFEDNVVIMQEGAFLDFQQRFPPQPPIIVINDRDSDDDDDNNSVTTAVEFMTLNDIIKIHLILIVLCYFTKKKITMLS